MERWLCKGKIHRVTVTEANMDYVGSITIDQQLMQLANIFPFEMVQITSLRTGTRWKTYAIPAPVGSGKICLNGPPAHWFQPGDLVIILSVGMYSDAETPELEPTVIFVDRENRVTGIEKHIINV